MRENYFNFIIGLQNSAQLYFDQNSHNYQNIAHTWCNVSNDIFLVKDLETNQLLYDSVDHLVTDLFNQGIQSCRLIPSKLLLINFPESFKQYQFETRNYPVAIFSGLEQNFALIKLHHEKVKPLSHSYDPREFNGFPSSQNYEKYLLFTLVKLDLQQIQTFNQFNTPLNWQTYYEQLSNTVLDHSFNFKNDLSLTLVNNLSLQDNTYDYYFLKDSSPKLNLAFSLIHKIENIQDIINNEISMYLTDRSFNSSYIGDNYSQIEEYQTLLNNALIELISHTANDYENAYINEQFKPISKSKIRTHIIREDLSDDIEDTNDVEEPQTSRLISTLYLILFLTAIFGLLYGVFWLFSNFAFAKFVIITFGVIIFLAVWSKN